MKLPIGIIAKFLLKRVVVPALSKAVEKGKLDKRDVKDVVGDAVLGEVLKRVA